MNKMDGKPIQSVYGEAHAVALDALAAEVDDAAAANLVARTMLVHDEVMLDVSDGAASELVVKAMLHPLKACPEPLPLWPDDLAKQRSDASAARGRAILARLTKGARI